MSHPDLDLAEYEAAMEVFLEWLCGDPWRAARPVIDDQTFPDHVVVAYIGSDEYPDLTIAEKSRIIAAHRKAVLMFAEVNSDPDLWPYDSIDEAFGDAFEAEEDD